MPSDLYRRHIKSCSHRAEGVNFTGCECPIWFDGKHPVTGRRIRRSVETRDWKRAQKRVDRWESDIRSGATEPADIPKIETLVTQFLHDCGIRKLADSTIARYGRALARFTELVKIPANEIDVAAITAWRNIRSEAEGRSAGSKVSGNGLRTEIETVRVFCEYLVDHELLLTNPARKVKAPRNDNPPTLPFSPIEVKALIAAVDQIDNNFDAGIERARLRARAMVLLLLYSGFRISDAVKLERARLGADGRLLVRMMKTGAPLYVKLPKAAIDVLKALPVESKYFLWSGTAKLDTAIGSARRTIDCLGRLSKINAHPHRFRDTFSVELLKSGASLRTVQLLLGHTSIKTTEKHYAPYVVEFQRELDRATAKLKFG